MWTFLNHIFPPLCLHCESNVEKANQLFCKGCAGFFELIDPNTRCRYCFAENDGRSACKECVQKRRCRIQMASALDYLGAVCSLVKKLKYGRMPYLAKTSAAFITAQLFCLEWPMPDLIVPTPPRNWFYGTSHAQLLAEHVGRSLRIPCMSLIKRQAGDFSQARLSKTQREQLSASHFYLKKNCDIENKIILIIDDVITTGTTLRHTAETLSQGFPAKIFALSLARST